MLGTINNNSNTCLKHPIINNYYENLQGNKEIWTVFHKL